jgi:hypothetical protein
MPFLNTIPQPNDNISSSQPQLLGNNGFLGSTAGNMSDGYYKFPNGITMQWGSKVKNSNATRSVTFPIAFGSSPAPPWTIQVTPFGKTTISKANSWVADDIAPTNVGFTIVNGSGESIGFYWFAVGPST